MSLPLCVGSLSSTTISTHSPKCQNRKLNAPQYCFPKDCFFSFGITCRKNREWLSICLHLVYSHYWKESYPGSVRQWQPLASSHQGFPAARQTYWHLLYTACPGTNNIYVALFQHSYLYVTYVHHLCNSYVHMYIVSDTICICMSHMCWLYVQFFTYNYVNSIQGASMSALHICSYNYVTYVFVVHMISCAYAAHICNIFVYAETVNWKLCK